MAYKIVIDNKISTKVKGFYKDASGVSRAFNFELVQDRIDHDELKDVLADKGETTGDFVKRVTHGWKGQRLVLTEDDQPADFNAESLAALLSIAGMANFCFQAYIAQVLVTEKN
jgi:hypothetical protein